MKGKRKIAASAVMAILLLPMIAKAQTVIVPPFRVDDAPAGVAAGSPAAQKLHDNKFVIMWADLRNFDTQVYASIYDNLGSVIRDDYRIDDGAAGSISGNTGPGCSTIDSSGNFFVTYSNSPDFINVYGRIRKFLPNGDPAGPSVEIINLGGSSQVIHVTMGFNNKIILTFGGGQDQIFTIVSMIII